MGDSQMSKKSDFFIICLVIVNLLLITKLYVGSDWNLSWTKFAASEAEFVGAIACSGHGKAYLDGLLLDGIPVCECHQCYAGPDCSHFSPDCVVDADGGDPLFLEPFWMQNAASSALVVAGWHRMSYSYSDGTHISIQLEKYIRKLHSIVGNAVTTGKYIVFGAGSTQVISAAVRALSPENSSAPAKVVASIPFYALYELQVDIYRSVDYVFEGDTNLWRNISNNGENFVEFVTSPNNPDGQMNKGILDGPNVKTIYDRAYYWPHFTAISEAADEDLMVFTMSKITGHAGSRFGWALIKDEDVYQRMVKYIGANTMGVSRDTQLRVLKLLKVALEGNGRELFEFGHQITSKRWQELNYTLSTSNRFSLQTIPPQFCNYFQKVRDASPAYAWVKCEREEDTNCYEVLLKDAKVIGRLGSIFGAENRYVRLSLIRSQDDFDLLIQQLKKLVSQEEYGATKIM